MGAVGRLQAAGSPPFRLQARMGRLRPRVIRRLGRPGRGGAAGRAGGKFRVLHKEQWRGMDFEAQADAIRRITQDFNVEYMAIDTTGIGQGVYQLVRQFYPNLVALNYSPDVKGRLVLKGLSVIGKGRLEFDAGWTNLAQSFMAIRKTMTASGKQVTYEASRSEETGHADLAWACLHALGNEPLEGITANDTGFMEFSN